MLQCLLAPYRNITLSIITLVTLFCYSSISHSGVDLWTSVSPYGGVIQTVAVDPVTANTLYVGTAYNGIFKSTNGGTSWQNSSRGLESLDISVITIDPNNPTILYAGTNGGGIYKSSDGGARWSTSNTGLKNLNVTAIVIDPNNRTNLYAGTIGNLFFSGNSGDSWTPIGVSGTGRLTCNAIQTVVLDPLNPATLYVGTATCGLFRSVDSGQRWTEANGGLPSNSNNAATINVRYLTFDASGNLLAGTQGDGYFKGTPTGDPNNPLLWSAANGSAPNAISSTTVNTIVSSITSPNTHYAATLDNVAVTTDNATTWSTTGNQLQGTRVLTLAIDYNTPTETLYAGTTQGIYKLTLGATEWSAINNGIINFNVTDIAVVESTPTTLYATTRNSGLLMSDNGGSTWRYANSGLTDLHTLAVAVDNNTAPQRTLYVGTENAGVFKSTDLGVSWNSVDDGLSDPKITDLLVDTTTSNRLYAASPAGINLTTNGGVNWSAANSGIAGQHDIKIDTLAFVANRDTSQANRLYASASASGLFSSPDDAISWGSLSSGLDNIFVYAMIVSPNDPDVLYVGTNGGGVYKSIDGGLNWFASNNGLAPATQGGLRVNALAIQPGAPTATPATYDVIYAATRDYGVFQSRDGGTTWSALNDGLTDKSVNRLAFNNTTKTLYAGTHKEGVAAMTLTTSGSPVAANPVASEESNNGGGAINFILLALLASRVLRGRYRSHHE